MSLNQPSIEQMNRDRVNGMITKAHDLQFKMEQISEINNTRGPKPPMQERIVRPQSSMQPNRKIRIQVNDQLINKQNNAVNTEIQIQYKDDYNLEQSNKETDRTAQHRKCKEL